MTDGKDLHQSPRPGGEPLLPADPADRRRAIAAISFAALAVGLAYFTMYQPVHRAITSGGELRYSLKGVMLPPVFLYLAVLAVTVDVRGGQVRRTDATGKRRLTQKGWLVALGAVAVAATALCAWMLYLRALGFRPVR